METAQMGGQTPDDGPLTLLEALAEAARLVPPGRAVTYGGLAGMLGVGGPRQAGRAMAESGPGVPWWRIVRADGTLPTELAERARGHRAQEGTPVRDVGGARVDLRAAAWEPSPRDRRALRRLAARTRGPVTGREEEPGRAHGR